MRIVQIIDSLEAGGAERMAVNYANALVGQIEFSGLVATRQEGVLKNQLDETVSYLFLNKKKAVDFKALFRLRNYVIANKINIVHAHGTSFFTAFLLKLLRPSVALVWHDHYGNSEFLIQRPFLIHRFIITFFIGVISVNQKLKTWSISKLKAKEVIVFPNFFTPNLAKVEPTILKGIEGKRIICLANLRIQKDHFMLLEVAKRVKKKYSDWTFHLIGKDFEDEYSREIKDKIITLGLENTVYIYGTKLDITSVLEQAAIAILTSKSEGLPVALLEYGWCKKPVVVTDVGEISTVVINNSNGFLVIPQRADLFFNAIERLINDNDLKTNFGNLLHQTIVENHSETVVITNYLNWISNLV